MSLENARASPPRTMLFTELPPSYKKTTHERKKYERTECRERKGEEHGDRRPHAPKEDQDHQRCQKQSDAALVQQRFNGRFNELGLIEDHFRDQFLRAIEQFAG